MLELSQTMDFLKKGGDRVAFGSAPKPHEVNWAGQQLIEQSTIAGATLWQIPDHFEGKEPSILLTTTAGQQLLNNKPHLFELFQSDPDTLPQATHPTSGTNYTTRFISDGQAYYLKQYNTAAAKYEFIGMQLLENDGVHLCPRICASNNRILTVELPGPCVSEKIYKTRVKKYYDTLEPILKRLVRHGQWLKGGDLDIDVTTRENMWERNLKSHNPLDWFTLIDAVHF